MEVLKTNTKTRKREATRKRRTTFISAFRGRRRKFQTNDLIIVMGDMNGKIGADNTDNNRTMGKHGCGTMNENGERLVYLCSINDIVIGGTLFPHHEIHKLTRYSPNGRDKNQIDHLIFNGKWRRSLQGVEVGTGDDISSDHHLGTALVKVKLKRAGPWIKGHSGFDVGKLSGPVVRKTFIPRVKNRFLALADLDQEERRTAEEAGDGTELFLHAF